MLQIFNLVGLWLRVGHFCGKRPAQSSISRVFATLYQRASLVLFPSTTCIALHHTASHCNTLQHTATHCNTVQHRDRLLTPGSVPYQFPAQPLRLPLPILLLLQNTSSPPPILLHLLFLHFFHGAGHSATHVSVGATRPNCANSDTEDPN